MDEFQHRRLIEALEQQTAAIKSIHALIVRIVVWSVVAGVAVGLLVPSPEAVEADSARPAQPTGTTPSRPRESMRITPISVAPTAVHDVLALRRKA